MIFTVYDDDIKEVDGLKVFEIPKGFSGFLEAPYIEILGTSWREEMNILRKSKTAKAI